MHLRESAVATASASLPKSTTGAPPSRGRRTISPGCAAQAEKVPVETRPRPTPSWPCSRPDGPHTAPCSRTATLMPPSNSELVTDTKRSCVTLTRPAPRSVPPQPKPMHTQLPASAASVPDSYLKPCQMCEKLEVCLIRWKDVCVWLARSVLVETNHFSHQSEALFYSKNIVCCYIVRVAGI